MKSDAPNNWRNKIQIGFFLLLTSFLAFESWYHIVSTFAPDFSVFYGAAKRVILHLPLTGQTGLFTGFEYPPPTVFFFFPLLFLPYALAQSVWVSISFFLIPVCVYLSIKLYPLHKLENQMGQMGLTFFLSAVAFWSFPVKFTLGMGQINLVSLMFFLGSVLLLRNKKIISGNTVLFLSILTKPQVLFFLPFFFLGGYRRNVVVVVLLILSTLLLFGAFFGWNYVSDYFFVRVPELLAFSGREIYYNQSLSAFASRILPLEIARIVTVGISGLLVLGSAIFVKKEKNSIFEVIPFLLPIFLLVEPIAWQHHLVFLIPTFIYLISRLERKRELLLFWCSLFLVSVNIPNPTAFYTSLIFSGTVLSHGFWGMVGVGVLGFLSLIKKRRSDTV